MLSASTLQSEAVSLFDTGVLLNNSAVSVAPAEGSFLLDVAPVVAVSLPPPPRQPDTLATGALLDVSPFPFEQTFQLHSFPGATKTIYLDFDGFVTRETQWNIDFELPNIQTPAFDIDGNLTAFSNAERLIVQRVWERVAEDFRPFQVNVTTEDPGVEALRNSGGSDQEWGQRVVIGGDSTFDWFTPADGRQVGGVSYNSFTWDSDTPNFVFGGDFGVSFADIAEVVSHETGHALGLAHDGQFRFYENIEEDPPELVKLYVEYYPGHGSGDTAWAPIMGVGYGKTLTQWSKSEYFNATNNEEGTTPLQDDLAIISTINGFDYRTDDVGNTIATASEVVSDPLTLDADTVLFEGEGIIERNTDIDVFSFIVEGLGELVSLDIQPFHNGPNLDILAKVLDSSGIVVATSNSIDVLDATFTDLQLLPGTYYVSIEGDGRPITFIDPAFHPGPYQAEGNPPVDPLPPDTSDWGYTKYGSLGYYSVEGTRKKNLVVGVDFDVAGGMNPRNWNSYDGGSSPETLTNLISETGLNVPYELTISTTGTAISTVASTNPIPANNLPAHGIPLDKLTGYLTTTTDIVSFEWSNLTPDTVYQVYVFGHASTAIKNHITVVGGTWNGVQQVYDFTQDVAANGLVVNDAAPGTNDLTTYSLLVVSDANGTIDITVQGADGAAAGIAGLAISTTKVGTLSGQKFEDANGDRVHQSSESGLEGWVIYLDLNNDGTLNKTADRVTASSAVNVPQKLQDYATVKNDLFFPEADVISDINVTFDIDHTYDADLNLTLVSPAGTRVTLFGDLGSSGDNFRNTTLDDEAATALASASAPFTGSFRPQNPLSAFDGEIAAGKWTLEIEDDATGDTGRLNSWSISVTFAGRYLEPNQTSDVNGDFAFTNLRAGQYHVREFILPSQTTAGWRQSIAPAPVTVRSGANVVGVELGNWIPTAQHGAIHGSVFDDANANGAKDSGESGLAGWAVYLDANGSGSHDIATTPVTFSATGLSDQIRDFEVVNSPIVVSGLGTVFNVEVTLDITHSFVGDLDAYLLSPSGRQVELFTQVGDQYNDFTNLTLSDSATRSISSLGLADLPYTGTWKPEGLLSDFIGDDMAGTWILQIRDTAFADEGTLNSWSLKVTSGELSRVTDADGNYEFLDLPAGSQVVREVNQAGWNLIAPNPTSIPAANWSGSQWDVAIAALGNVTDVNFGNQAVVALPGDYDRSNVVDAADYVLWRKKLGQTVTPPYDGPDGNGNGVVDSADYTVWRSHFGEVHGTGTGSLALAASGSLDASSALTDLSLTESEPVATFAASPVALIDSVFENSLPTSSRRAVYRPAVVTFDSGDQALLAWLADAGLAAGGTSEETGDTTVQGDTEPVDSVFESLEALTLGNSGAV